MTRDVESSIEVLGDSIHRLERQQAARKALPEALDQFMALGLFSLSRSEVNQTTFQTLKSSGRLSAIESRSHASWLLLPRCTLGRNALRRE